jgi:hypothetical protein
MSGTESAGPEVELLRVDGLAAQLLQEVCERAEGCVRVEARANGYAMIFSPDTEHIDAWQRVHNALMEVDPGAQRLSLVAAEPASPRMATEIIGSATRVNLDAPPAPAS